MWIIIPAAIAGLVVAKTAHDFITRTKGQKAKVGDIAFVQFIALQDIPMAGSAESFTMNALRQMVGTGTQIPGAGELTLVPLKISAIGPLSSKAGGGYRKLYGNVQLPAMGVIAALEFSSGSVKRLVRNGVDIQDGPNRIY